jgi:hypothetical protein
MSICARDDVFEADEMKVKDVMQKAQPAPARHAREGIAKRMRESDVGAIPSRQTVGWWE